MELNRAATGDSSVSHEGAIFKDSTMLFTVSSCTGELDCGIFDTVMCCIDEECSCPPMDCASAEEVESGENFKERCCKRLEVYSTFISEVVFEGGKEGISYIVLKESLHSLVIPTPGCKLLCGDIIDGIGRMLKDILGGSLASVGISVLLTNLNCTVESSISCSSSEVFKFLTILLPCASIRKLYGLSVGIFVKVSPVRYFTELSTAVLSRTAITSGDNEDVVNLVDDEALNECTMRVCNLGVLVRLSCVGNNDGDLGNSNGLDTESCSQRLAAA